MMAPKKYRIARTLWAGLFPFFIAEKLGKLPREIEIIDVNEYDQTLELLASGDVDANFNSLADTLLLVGRGIKLKLIMPSDLSIGVDGFLSKMPFTNIIDIKGKRIGLSLMTYPHILLLEVLKKYGLSEGDVELVPVRGEEVVGALQAGKIDVGHTWGIHIDQGIRKGLNLLFTSEEYPGLLVDALVVREEILEEKSLVWNAFAEALDWTVHWWMENHEEGISILAEQTHLPGDMIEEMIKGTTFFTLETAGTLYQRNIPTPPNLFASGRIFSRFFEEKRILDQSINLDSILDPVWLGIV